MAEHDKAESARRMHEARKRGTDAKANAAIDDLVSRREKVTFSAVAGKAGVSAATLYAHAEVRARIERLREAGAAQPPTRGRTKSSEAAVIESLKRKIERLGAENARLKEENNRLKAAAEKTYSDYLKAL